MMINLSPKTVGAVLGLLDIQIERTDDAGRRLDFIAARNEIDSEVKVRFDSIERLINDLRAEKGAA